MTPLTLTPSDPSAKFLLSVPMTIYSIGLEVLVPKGEVLQTEDTTMILFNWKLRLPTGHFGFLMPLNQQAKGVIALYWVIDATVKGKLNCCATIEVSKNDSGIQKIS